MNGNEEKQLIIEDGNHQVAVTTAELKKLVVAGHIRLLKKVFAGMIDQIENDETLLRNFVAFCAEFEDSSAGQVKVYNVPEKGSWVTLNEMNSLKAGCIVAHGKEIKNSLFKKIDSVLEQEIAEFDGKIVLEQDESNKFCKLLVGCMAVVVSLILVDAVSDHFSLLEEIINLKSDEPVTESIACIFVSNVQKYLGVNFAKKVKVHSENGKGSISLTALPYLDKFCSLESLGEDLIEAVNESYMNKIRVELWKKD